MKSILFFLIFLISFSSIANTQENLNLADTILSSEVREPKLYMELFNSLWNELSAELEEEATEASMELKYYLRGKQSMKPYLARIRKIDFHSMNDSEILIWVIKNNLRLHAQINPGVGRHLHSDEDIKEAREIWIEVRSLIAEKLDK